MRKLSLHLNKTPRQPHLPKLFHPAPTPPSLSSSITNSPPIPTPTPPLPSCPCAICTSPNLPSSLPPPSPSINYSTYKSKTLSFLRSLSRSPTHPGYKIQILSTCFYSSGKPQSIFLNGEQSVIQMELSGKTGGDIVRVLLEHGHRGVERWGEKGLEMLFVRNLHLFVDLPLVHEKFLRVLLPEHLEYPPYGGNKTRHVCVHNNGSFLVRSTDQRDRQRPTSVVYFSDGYSCVLNEGKLRELLLCENKNMEYIMMVTSYVEPWGKEGGGKFHTSWKGEGRMEKEERRLYELACREVEMDMGILNHLDDGYVTQEELAAVREECRLDGQKYVDYEMYKTIAYLEKEVNLTTLQLVLGWIRGEDGGYYLSFVYEFSYEYRFVEESVERRRDMVDRRLEKRMMESWEMAKERRVLEEMGKKGEVRGESEIVFNEMFPEGDFGLLRRGGKERKGRGGGWRGRVVKNPVGSMSVRLGRDGGDKFSNLVERMRTPSFVKTIERERSTEMRSSFSRRVSFSVSPRKRGGE